MLPRVEDVLAAQIGKNLFNAIVSCNYLSPIMHKFVVVNFVPLDPSGLILCGKICPHQFTILKSVALALEMV